MMHLWLRPESSWCLKSSNKHDEVLLYVGIYKYGFVNVVCVYYRILCRFQLNERQIIILITLSLASGVYLCKFFSFLPFSSSLLLWMLSSTIKTFCLFWKPWKYLFPINNILCMMYKCIFSFFKILQIC